MGGTGVAVGVGVAVGLDAAVAVGDGVSVGAIYGVAVGAGATAPPAGVAVSVSGSAGFVQASTADAAATRATIAPAMATVNRFLLEAILGCPSHGFMTHKCYTTREQGYGACHCATAVVMARPWPERPRSTTIASLNVKNV